eukprot:70136-Alexandrium_andersonii.AAC.1
MAREMTVFVISGVHMGSYGGETQKSLKLYSNASWVSELVRAMPLRKPKKDHLTPNLTSASGWPTAQPCFLA